MTNGPGENYKVHYAKSVHGAQEIEAVNEVLKSSTMMGENVARFEQSVASLFAKSHGVMVNSGSSANYLAFEIADLPESSEVITPALTFSTTLAPIIKKNLVPVFVDVKPGTYVVDVDQIEEMITERTSALMIPALLGNIPNWRELRRLAEEHDLLLIEDSADTLGATLDGESTGAQTDISTTSFYGSHVINCAGNGGMLCVNDAELARKAKLLRAWGRRSATYQGNSLEERFNVEVDGIQYDGKFVFDDPGYNFLPSEPGAAFGRVQLTRLEDFIDRRQQHFRRLRAFFENFESWMILPEELDGVNTAWLAFPITIHDGAPFSRQELQLHLEREGIQTRTIFTGNVLRQPGFSEMTCVTRENGYPHTDQVMRGGLLLGCHHGLSSEQLDYMINALSDFLE